MCSSWGLLMIVRTSRWNNYVSLSLRQSPMIVRRSTLMMKQLCLPLPSSVTYDCEEVNFESRWNNYVSLSLRQSPMIVRRSTLNQDETIMSPSPFVSHLWLWGGQLWIKMKQLCLPLPSSVTYDCEEVNFESRWNNYVSLSLRQSPMIVRRSTLNQDETIMSPSPFVSHLWLWGGQLWIKMKQLCLPLPSSVTYDCEEVNFESRWNNYVSLSLRQSPMIVRRSTLNQDETIMSPSPFVSHLWLWGGQLWIKMKQLCLPLPSSVTYDCEEVNFESRWNNYVSLSLRQSPMIVRRSTLNQDETIMSPSPFVSHLWLWGGQLWIKMKQLCLPLPSSVTYDCEEVNFESRWNNYVSLSLRQSPMIVRRSTLNQDETIMPPSPFVSHLWLWGGQLWIKMKQLCLPLPSSVTYDCEDVNFESRWNNYVSLSLRQSPMIVRRSTLNQDETIMPPSPFVSHLWLWGGQLWIKMKQLCLPLPSSVTYDCEEVNFESRWNNYASLSLRQSPMIVRTSTLNPKETVQQVQPPLIASGSILKPRVTFLPFFIAVSST